MAGIESGARHAMYFADDAVIVTNPELSSCRWATAADRPLPHATDQSFSLWPALTLRLSAGLCACVCSPLPSSSSYYRDSDKMYVCHAQMPHQNHLSLHCTVI